MTREEKVNLLNELLYIEEKNDIGNLTRAERREFQQWVEDLKQEPCECTENPCLGKLCRYYKEPCEDAISRQATIDALWKALFEYENKTEKQFIDSEELDIEDWIQHRIFVQNMSDIDRQTILNMPSVKSQPQIGRWIEVANGRGGHECDLCHEYAPSYKNGDEYLSQYCPNCGAKMEVEE